MTTSTFQRALVRASTAHLEQTARRYAQNPNLSKLLPDTGVRTWARLADEDGVELWLISWPDGAETGWHDHAGSAGAFAVAEGRVVEETWALRDAERGAVRRRSLREGEARAFGGQHVHNVRGAAPGRSLTVHAYSPRLASMTAHVLTDHGPRPVSTTSEGADW